MSKLDLTQRVPATYERQTWSDIIRAICGQVNGASEGRLAASYNAQSSVPTGGSVAYAVGDFVKDSNCTVTNGTVRLGWVCTVGGTPGTFQEARVMVANFGPITSALAGDVTINNSANFFDGPSIAQGTSGTWLVIGAVTVKDSTAGGINITSKLWDGTTVIASTQNFADVASEHKTQTLAGFITNPAGNLRMSVKTGTTTGTIVANDSGTGKDSVITAIRIG